MLAEWTKPDGTTVLLELDDNAKVLAIISGNATVEEAQQGVDAIVAEASMEQD